MTLIHLIHYDASTGRDAWPQYAFMYPTRSGPGARDGGKERFMKIESLTTFSRVARSICRAVLPSLYAPCIEPSYYLF